MERTWDDVFKSYIADEHKALTNLDLNPTELEPITNKKAFNTYVAGTMLLCIEIGGGSRNAFFDQMRDCFYDWTTPLFARMSPHLRSTIVDYLYYQGIYCDNLGRHNAERLAELIKLEKAPILPESEAASASVAASRGLAIRRPVSQ
ncbi:hypothetical protein Daesc_002082 [Daldinia eschscholtzii]|uniref:Uncharacterized protein n=1 Tax=Daldinia eschscholtzii TaxID=292717 RepID=A0AAX6MX97_9PEZI